ncbi:SUKH-4 family immunity protein [Streptomyces sp. NPDC001178]
MVTFAQAQERAEEWINGDVPAYQHREVRVREFGLGFVVWAEDRAEGPRSDGGLQRLVIARDSGEATLWPSLPVGEVIRRYEEEYGRRDEAAEPVPAASARVDLNQTSFLLSPPEWLQEAADKLGIADRRGGAAVSSGDGARWPEAGAGDASGAAGSPAGATPWAGTDTNGGGEDLSVPLPATVFAPPLNDAGEETPPDAETALMAGGSGLPRTTQERALDEPGAQDGTPPPPPGYGYPQGAGAQPPGAPGYGYPQAAAAQASPPPPPAPPSYGYPQAPGAPGRPLAPNAGDIADAATSKAAGPRRGSSTPPPPSAPPPPPGPGAGGYVPTQLVSALGPEGPEGAAPGAPGGAPNPPGAPTPPGVPHPPGAPNAPGGTPSADVHQAATMLADPSRMGPGTPQRPGAPGAPGAGAPQPPGPPGAPQPPGAPFPPGAPGMSAPPQPPAAPGAPGAPGIPQAPSTAGAPGGPGVPQPPGAPGAPGFPQPSGAPGGPGFPQPPGAPGGSQPSGAGQPPVGPGGPGGPGFPQPPGAPGGPSGSQPSGAPGGSGAPQPPVGPGGPGGPGFPQPPGAPGGSQPSGAGGGSRAGQPPVGPGAQGGPGFPQPPGAPGGPGGSQPSGAPAGPGFPQPPGAPGAPGFPQPPGAPNAPVAPGTPPPPGAPGGPGGPGAPGAAGGRGAVHHAETVLAGPPVGAPGAPPPPAPSGPGMAPGAPQPTAPPPAYGYPQPQGQPTVGPGYQAVLRYRAQDGSEQQLIRRSAPGVPHPEWQIFHELRGMNVPPDQVLELHTELESCELPGAYCARMIREQWPQARITSIAPYGTDHASRQQGMQQLLAHQGELHQVADGPARPAPVRAPLPPVQAAPPIPPEAVGQELAGAFGPGVFRFEQAAVSRQGVPPVVAHSLVAAGLPTDMGPFFWAQAQPGRPVPTLAELAQERGVQPASDAGSYLVMGSDFGRAVCVQYGTANIVAVPVEAGPGGAPVPPQFVNTGLPEFQRCLALLGRMWRLRFGLNQEQAGRWTVDFQAQLASLDPAALGSPESWWSVLLEQMWDGLL